MATRKLTGAVTAARKVLGRKAAEPAAPEPAAKTPATKAAPAAKKAAVPAVKASAKKAPAKKAPAKKTVSVKKTAAAPAQKAASVKKTAAAPAKKAAAAPVKKAAAAPAKKAAAAPVKKAAAAPAKKAVVAKAAAVAPAEAPAVVAVPAKKAPVRRAPAKKAAPEPVVVDVLRAGGLPILEGEDAWTKAERDEIVAELNEQRVHSLKVIADLEVELTGLMKDSGDGAGQDQADVGATSFERDQELTVLNGEKEKINQIERAFNALDSDTYGICESCGRAIGKNRLLAFPRATLCMDCKRREERR